MTTDDDQTERLNRLLDTLGAPTRISRLHARLLLARVGARPSMAALTEALRYRRQRHDLVIRLDPPEPPA